MTQAVVFKTDQFHWVDVVDPSREELEALALTYGLHSTSVQDCLDPEHLPKFERIEGILFLILRAHDEVCSSTADTVQELTRKLAIFCRKDRFVITIHRVEQPFIREVREKWARRGGQGEAVPQKLISDLFRGVLASYDRPIEMGLDQLERLEMGVFETEGAEPFEVRKGYYLKRRAAVFKRMLQHVREVIPRLAEDFERAGPFLQDLREYADSLFAYADEMTESINSLINLHISLATQKTTEASHKTNEVVRVLTIFSVFLLPLNVVTGIYGMNFEHMPELHWRAGYPIALLMMVTIVGVIYFWFRNKGWLKE
jgi:magnesium transporter